MISIRQLAGSLHGLRLVLSFDVRGWTYFDRSLAGFWGSFIVAVALAPLELLSVVLEAGQHTSSLGFWPYMLVQLLSYVLNWTLYPFVMLYMVRLLQQTSRYFSYMVVYNWLQLPLALFLYVIHLLGDAHILTKGIIDPLELLNLVAFFVYGTFIAGVGLQIGTGTALSLVVLDFVLSLITGELISRI